MTFGKNPPLNEKLQIRYVAEKKYYRRVRKQGNSLVITVPKALVEDLGIDEDQIVEFVALPDRLELIPAHPADTPEKGRTKYDRVLDDMMEKADLPADKLKKLHIK